MITIFFKEKSWIAKLASQKLKSDNCAIVIGRTIHLHKISIEQIKHNKPLLRHEVAHVLQWKRYGYICFPVLYLFYSWKYGYFQNPFEIEARANEENENILFEIQF